MALHRLRNILGDENAVRLRGGRVSLDSRRCWVDARAFESMLEKAGYALKNGDGKEAAHLLEKAAALYRGPFLPDEGKPVIKSFRERLQARFAGLSKS
ncbi:MAG: bacterial transcriptional activator domain-containing protein [Nitrospiraceae bacterium]|nr:bacterial transcriptional activator domain-containing protein [Nitrospiraceae bacterium]